MYTTAEESQRADILGKLKAHKYDSTSMPDNIAYTDFVLSYFSDANEVTRNVLDDYFETSLEETSHSEIKSAETMGYNKENYTPSHSSKVQPAEFASE